MEQEPDTTTSEKKSKTTIFVLVSFLLIIIFAAALATILSASKLPCRQSYGIPRYTGASKPEQFESGDKNFSVILVDACVISIDSVSDTEYELEIGFFEDIIKFNKYKARFGGKEPSVAVCNITTQDECVIAEPKEVAKKLRMGDIHSFYLVVTDMDNELVMADKEYVDFMDRLKTAISSSDNFPQAEKVIQISQVEL